MYAMSVSPLSLETLERISPILLAELGTEAESAQRLGTEGEAGSAQRLGGKTAARDRDDAGKRRGRVRDFTNNILIGRELFPVETLKGKKHVKLPWNVLEKVKAELEEKIPDPERYKGLRGTIILDSPGGKYSLLAGEKLSLILGLLPGIDMDGVLDRSWPRRENFESTPESLGRLLDNLPLILRPAPWKHADKKGDSRGRELGFIALFTDGKGSYWFRCSRGFHTSLNESIASLETLIDELGEDVDPQLKHIVNQTYRRLSDYLG
jgi:hypothetical protein